MNYIIKKRSFGEIWLEAFKLYADNFTPLFAIAIVSYLPMLFFRMPQMTIQSNGEPQADLVSVMLWFLLLLFLSAISMMFILEYLARKYQGFHLNATQYLQSLKTMWLRVVAMAIFTTLMIGMGMMAFVFPGIYAALTLSMAPCVMMVERQPINVAVIRSVWLTQNKKIEIFSYSLVAGILSFLVERVLVHVFSLMNSTPTLARLQNALGMLTQGLLAPIGACVFILLYFNLLIEKEGHLIKKATEPAEPTEEKSEPPEE